MAPFLNTEAQLLQKRKFYVRFLVIFTVLLLLAFNLGSWLFSNRMDFYLEIELEKRLETIAGLTAQKIETEYLDDITTPLGSGFGKPLVRLLLARLIREYELESAFIIDHNYRVLIDAQNKFPEGQLVTYLKQDSVAIESAWSDSVSASSIHVFEGNKFKSVYAPLHNEFFEINALLVLEASAEFFELLDLFKQGLIFGGLVSFGLIVIFSFFISWMISLLIRSHESLQQSEKLAAMGRMAASMAHEIRNPLGIIKGTADVLKEKYASRNEPEELFEFIAAEVQRLNLLVNNFLSFAREQKLNLKSNNLISTLIRAVAAIEREDKEKQVVIKFEPPANFPLFLFDEDTIQQVLFNFLINAIQAFELNGEINIQIDLASIKHKKFARISIADNGPGIEGDPQKIFEPFYSTKSSGSGLGLAICKQIIEKHGGRIEVETLPNNGTTFTFYLPITKGG